MRSFVTLLAAASTVAALTSAGTPAAAAGETCQGQAATVVGSPTQYELHATGGDDVIVTNGAQSVDAGAGDDLVCLTLTNATVDAGDGDDTVVASGEGSSVELGMGSDRFVGSTGADTVSGGIGFYRRDTERDVIDTGPAGASEDVVWSGDEGAPNPDEVRMGWGSLSWNGPTTRESVVDGGAGSLLQIGTVGTRHLTIDNAAATLQQRPAPALAIPGFTRFYVEQPKGLEGFTFRGSGRDELLSMRYADSPAGSEVDLAGGDDELVVNATRDSRKSSYGAGRGRDTIRVRMYAIDDLDLDMGRGRLSTASGRREVTTPATSFEDAQLKARDIEVVGTRGANDIELHGCRGRVDARGGDDAVSTYKQGPDQGPIICRDKQMAFDGGRGDDTLAGAEGRDRLIGGAGRDTADGREGRDTCRAEETTSCEARR